MKISVKEKDREAMKTITSRSSRPLTRSIAVASRRSRWGRRPKAQA